MQKMPPAISSSRLPGSHRQEISSRTEFSRVWTFWGFIAVLTSINTVLNPNTTIGIPRIELVASGVIECALWATITPFIFSLTQRYSLGGRKWFGRMLLFVLLGIAVSIGINKATVFLTSGGHKLYLMTQHEPILHSQGDPFVTNLWRLLDFAIYLVILSVGVTKDYLRRYRRHHDRLLELNVELGNARLHTLQAQLNPHFLFNTLNSVSSLINIDQEAAQDMLAQLSDLLRETLEREQLESSLADELQFTRRYLSIMQTRFHDRLSITEDIEPGVAMAKVPSFILQPLVENAIKHGVERLQGNGHIVIHGRRNGVMLVLSVSNIGCLTESSREQYANGSGRGLKITRSRLRHAYGTQHSFRLWESGENTVTAEVIFPYLAITPVTPYEQPSAA